MRRSAFGFLVLPPLMSAFCATSLSPAREPPVTAELSGRIADTAGQGVAGAVLTLTSLSDETLRLKGTTGEDGRYSFGSLDAGSGYLLEISAPGYARLVAGPVTLAPGKLTRLDLTLTPSSDLDETIRVEAQGRIVETSSTGTVTTINEEFIEGVPLVGRSFTDLLILAPGVTDTDADGNPNVRGSRDTGLQVRLDGTNITNPLTGHIGQQVNLETVEEVQIVTAGATAEFSRADGGFASVISKSGGNEVEGSFKVFIRSHFFDGDGASRDETAPAFNDSDAYITVGGPLRRDHLWYFVSLQRLDEQVPVVFPTGGFALREQESLRSFGKITWQADQNHKLAFQVNSDPAEFLGNNIGVETSAETDYLMRTGGHLPQLTWTAAISPVLLLQVIASRHDAELVIDPVSGNFKTLEIDRTVESNGQVFVALPCIVKNCQEDPFIRTIIPPGGVSRGKVARAEQERGPYNLQSDQSLERTSLRSDLSLFQEGWGQHAIKGGFEFALEEYEEEAIQNPVLTDRTCLHSVCGGAAAPSPLPPDTRVGSLFLETFDPLTSSRGAQGSSLGTYVQDSWKPLPNLSISAGIRLDHELIDARGYTSFDPLLESREALRRYDIWCDAADQVGAGCSITRTPGRMDGNIPTRFSPPPGHPALQFDLNDDGVLETSGPEGALISAPFSTPADRLPHLYSITNANLAPRFSISWDPLGHGRTKLYATSGRYHDRLFLGAVATEERPVSVTAEWRLNESEQALPGALSEEVASGLTIPQTDRDLATPYTDEWTVGFEQELAPEWAVSVAHIERRGHRLLQDVDLNHITCKGFDTAFGVDPVAVCGDGGRLELDRFGRIEITRGGSVFNVPNGAPDLYVLNPNFNQVLRVGNFNSSEYSATELSLRKRLHRNWQMLLAYTWSKARGDAESFTSQHGNDPAVSDKVSGYLDYDQRHVFKWQAVAHLKHEIVLGGTVEWASGLPFTFVSNVEDHDDVGNLTPQRVFSLTGEKNDQRNEAQLTINARLEKRLHVGKAYIAAFVEAENLLNTDDLVFREVDRESTRIIDGTRRFGRRWQLGAAIHF